MNILNVTLDDMKDTEVQRLMYVRASGYRKSLLGQLKRLRELGGDLPEKHVYKSAVNLYYLLEPATEAAVTVYWQYSIDSENENRKQAAELVLSTWREYCSLAKELVTGLKQLGNED